MLAAILKMGLARWPSCLQQRSCHGAVALWFRFGKKKALKITSKRKLHKAPVIIDQWKLPNVFKCEAFTGRVPLKAPRALSSFYRWVMICLLLLAVLNRVVNELRQTRDVTFPDVNLENIISLLKTMFPDRVHVLVQATQDQGFTQATATRTVTFNFHD